MNNTSPIEQAKIDAIADAEAPKTAPAADSFGAALAANMQAAAEKARAAKDRKNAAAKAKRAAAAAAKPEPKPAAKKAAKKAVTAPAKGRVVRNLDKPPKKPIPGAGGARLAAGRKPLFKEAMTKAVTVKLTERHYKAFHSIPEGGTTWLRRGLDEMLAAKRGK